jgi:prepilin-type N-terminal cleavage/methylation domain-containing protein
VFTSFRRRPAFSLIELLAVLVAVGVLVGVVLPRFQAYRRKAHVVAMVRDLRKLSTAQETFWKAVKRYTTDTAALNLALSPGVTLTLESADSTGWSARATRTGDPTACSIFYGSAQPLPPAVKANVIGCSGEGGESRRQKAESRKQKAEGRKQKAESRRQKAEGSELPRG